MERVSDQIQGGYFLIGDLGSSRRGSAVLQSRDRETLVGGRMRASVPTRLAGREVLSHARRMEMKENKRCSIVFHRAR